MSKKIVGGTVTTPLNPEKIGGSADAVLYTEQNLTEEQKAQARENIGVATIEEVLAALPIGEGVRY